MKNLVRFNLKIIIWEFCNRNLRNCWISSGEGYFIAVFFCPFIVYLMQWLVMQTKMYNVVAWLMRQFVWGIQSIVLRKFNKFFSVSSILVDSYLVYFVAVIVYVNIWFSINMFMFTRIDASPFVRTEKYDLVYSYTIEKVCIF